MCSTLTVWSVVEVRFGFRSWRGVQCTTLNVCFTQSQDNWGFTRASLAPQVVWYDLTPFYLLWDDWKSTKNTIAHSIKKVRMNEHDILSTAFPSNHFHSWYLDPKKILYVPETAEKKTNWAQFLPPSVSPLLSSTTFCLTTWWILVSFTALLSKFGPKIEKQKPLDVEQFSCNPSWPKLIFVVIFDTKKCTPQASFSSSQSNKALEIFQWIKNILSLLKSRDLNFWDWCFSPPLSNLAFFQRKTVVTKRAVRAFTNVLGRTKTGAPPALELWLQSWWKFVWRFHMPYKTERINVASPFTWHLNDHWVTIFLHWYFFIDIWLKVKTIQDYALPTFLCLYLGSRNFTILIQLDYEKHKTMSLNQRTITKLSCKYHISHGRSGYLWESKYFPILPDVSL